MEFCLALGNDYTSHLRLDVPKSQKNCWSSSRPTTGARTTLPYYFRELYMIYRVSKSGPSTLLHLSDSGAPPLVPSHQ